MAGPPKDLQAFLYRVVTTNDRIVRMIDEGLLRELPSHSGDGAAERTAIDDFGLEVRVRAKRMGAVYELLYCLENSMRELVESTLRETLGAEKWWTQGVPDPIRKSAESRARDDERARWHGP